MQATENKLQTKKAVVVTEEAGIGKGDQANAETLSEIECTSTKSQLHEEQDNDQVLYGSQADPEFDKRSCEESMRVLCQDLPTDRSLAKAPNSARKSIEAPQSTFQLTLHEQKKENYRGMPNPRQQKLSQQFTTPQTRGLMSTQQTCTPSTFDDRSENDNGQIRIR